MPHNLDMFAGPKVPSWLDISSGIGFITGTDFNKATVMRNR